MFRNYFIVALRNLAKNKVYTMINTTGLAIGVACALVIGLFVYEELSYDQFHANNDRIYRLLRTPEAVNSEENPLVSAALSYALKEELPEIEMVTCVAGNRQSVLYGTEKLPSLSGMAVDSSFLNVFTFPVVSGKRERLLTEPNEIVLTEATSQKIFGEENPVGKTIVLDGNKNIVVSAVVENPPINSHLQFEYLLPLQNVFAEKPWMLQESAHTLFAFFLLKNKTEGGLLEQKINELARGRSAAATPAAYSVEPLRDVYFNNAFRFALGKAGDLQTVKLFAGIALLVVFLAGVNYVNLETARSTKRALEVGLRKVTGAHRHQVVMQFLIEAFLVSTLAFFLAILLADIALPFFNSLMNRNISLNNHFTSPSFVLLLIALNALVGFASGYYPAFHFSGFTPARVLKGIGARSDSERVRKVLVVCQFVISVSLIIGVSIMIQQMNFVNAKDLGFESNQVITFSFSRAGGQPAFSIKNEIKQLAPVTHVTSAQNFAGTVLHNTNEIRRIGSSDQPMKMAWMYVDEDFLPALDIPLLAGNNFSGNSEAVSSAEDVLINREAARLLGFSPEDAIGQRIGGTDSLFSGILNSRVIGVFEDVHYSNLYEKIPPVVVGYANSWTGAMFVRIAPGQTTHALASLEAIFKKYTDAPFVYSFLDDRIRSSYAKDGRSTTLLGILAGIGLLIGCLGMLGLVAYQVEQRMKEISIRKVLGASSFSLLWIFSRKFLGLILLSFLVAFPLAYYGSMTWLAHFAYQVGVEPGIFIVAGLMAIVTSGLTVGVQVLRAVGKNPVDSLRSE